MLRRRAIILFVAITCALTWTTAWLIGDVWASVAGPDDTALVPAYLIYAAVFGWPPIVAVAIVRRRASDDSAIDPGVRPGTARYQTVAAVGALVVFAAAASVHALASGAARGRDVPLPSDAAALISGATGLVAIVTLVWLQAIGEELGWRGHFLAWLMRDLGRWRGLLAHGALWGLWYGPVFVLGRVDDAGTRIASFVVTCALLGALLGWLRLASRSIVVSATSNAILTIAAGLPFVLHGASSSRTAVYEPSGWTPLAMALVAVIVIGSLRARVAWPMRDLPARTRMEKNRR